MVNDASRPPSRKLTSTVSPAVSSAALRTMRKRLQTPVSEMRLCWPGISGVTETSTRPAILIAEFAKERSEAGQSPREAAINGAAARFRAVLMTSLALIFGVLPLAHSAGAGAGAQNAVGITIIGGMLGVTLIGLFVIPALYYAIQSMREWFHAWSRREDAASAQ